MGKQENPSQRDKTMRGGEQRNTGETDQRAPADPLPKPAGPAQTEQTPVPDQWLLEKTYPNAATILAPQPPLEDMLKDGNIVFDTSALLIPYESDEVTLLAIADVLKRVANEGRLFVPERALREFANRRGSKLTELALRVLTLRNDPINVAEIPFLGDSELQDRLGKERRKLETSIASYREALADAIATIRAQSRDDPTTKLYRELFPAARIIASGKSASELEADFDRRREFRIPPGYKDKHIGDLVIWHSILEHGLRSGKDTVLISKDVKEDWVHKTGEKELSEIFAPRFELIYEYRTHTNGKSFAQVQLAELLRFFHASPEAVKAVEESQRAVTTTPSEGDPASRQHRFWRTEAFERMKLATDRLVTARGLLRLDDPPFQAISFLLVDVIEKLTLLGVIPDKFRVDASAILAHIAQTASEYLQMSPAARKLARATLRTELMMLISATHASKSDSE